MTAVRALPFPFAALAALASLPLLSVPAAAEPGYMLVQSPRERVVVERYYDDAPRRVQRGRSGGMIQDMFRDDEDYVTPRRIPRSSERSRMSLDGGYYERYQAPRRTTRSYDYYDEDSYDDPYSAREPRIERLPRRLAGPPSAAGAGESYGRRSPDPKFVKAVVPYDGPEKPGTIVINTKTRYLYLVEADGMATRYGVGVGKEGFTWKGTETVTQKREWPDWRPPAEMRKRRPELPVMMAGGPSNPLGARAMYLGSTLYRIHGSNEPWTIGRAVSSGCIRMTNEDVTELYERVPIGATVKVI